MLGINIPEDEKGDWKVEIDSGECSLVKLSLGYSIMKDSQYEYDAHQWLWDNATGDIFIGGLGIGFLNKELIDNHNFNSVTIIENSQDVIDLVWPYCARDSRFTLIKEDIETWTPPANSQWDIGWFDTYLGDNPLTINAYFSAMKTKYGSHCNKMGTRLFDKDLHDVNV